MSAAPSRVLIVTSDDPALLALHDYLSFIGSHVDTSADLDDARALVRHMHYDAVIAAASPAELRAVRELAHELHSRHLDARLVLIADEGDVESVVRAECGVLVRRAQPISQLARQVRYAIHGAVRSA